MSIAAEKIGTAHDAVSASRATQDGRPGRNWNDSTLGSHLRAPIRNGYSPICPTVPTDIWILSLGAVTEAGFNRTGVKPAPLGDAQVLENLLTAGDIVVSRSNTPERVGLAGIYRGDPSPCSYPDLMMRVRTARSLDPEYLLIHLLSHRGRKFFSESARGSSSSMVKIDRAILESFPIPVPPLPEQRAIAEALREVDALIGALDQLIAKKRDLKQAAMQQLLTGNTRLSDFQGGWEIKQLGNIFEIGSSKRVFQSEWRIDGIPFYRAREVAALGETGRVENELFISEAMYSAFRAEHGVPAVGDMLVTGVGTLGKVYVVNDDRPFYFKDGNIIWFKSAGRISAEYLRQLYMTRSIEKQIADGAAGTTVGTYTITGAKKTKIPVPSLAEQRAIAAVLTDMDTELAALEQRRHKTLALKQAMMQELLTGKTRLV